MLAAVAALLFLLACFSVTIGSVPLVTLGLFLLALHFVVPIGVPFGRRNT